METGQVLARRRAVWYTGNLGELGDGERLVHLGTTSRGTPVWLNRCFINADLRIVVGDAQPHQFAGFSGGVKTAAIWLAGTETINRNHAMMTSPQAGIDRYDDNPVRQDIEEIGRMAGIHLVVNAVRRYRS